MRMLILLLLLLKKREFSRVRLSPSKILIWRDILLVTFRDRGNALVADRERQELEDSFQQVDFALKILIFQIGNLTFRVLSTPAGKVINYLAE